MKKIILLSVLFLCILACNEKPEENYILFSGKILNPVSKEISLRKRAGKSIEKKIKLNEDGSFNDTIKSGSGLYSFNDSKNRMSIYLVNRGKIHLTYDGNDSRSTVDISGKYSETSNYMLSKGERISELMGEQEEFYTKTESEYLKHAKFITDSMNNFLESFDNIPEAFLEKERKELEYKYLLYLANYEEEHKIYTKKPDFKVSDSFLTELRAIDFNNEKDFKLSYSYKELFPWRYEKEILELAKKEDGDISLAKMKIYATIPNDYIRNELLVDNSVFNMSYTKKLDEFYQIFLSYSQPTEFRDIVKEKYDKLKKVTKGQPSPTFTGYINHAGGKTSLEDLRGKYIYIDVWATWCGPCLAELPSLQKVEKEFHGKNIHFVSISIDTEKAFYKWKKMVTDKNMGGIQLIADNAWSSSFIDGYQIDGIPRFILLDPEGKIVSQDAPQPSDPDLIVLFKNLNI